MSTYQTESHLRSLLKGISWRIIATADTILLVWLVTCTINECSVGDAIAIGVTEFLIKWIIYYVHERIWQARLVGQKVTSKTTLYKTIVWRIIATTTTFLISGAVLEHFGKIAIIIALLELVSKFILYYAHERLWLRIPLGRIRSFFNKK